MRSQGRPVKWIDENTIKTDVTVNREATQIISFYYFDKLQARHDIDGRTGKPKKIHCIDGVLYTDTYRPGERTKSPVKKPLSTGIQDKYLEWLSKQMLKDDNAHS